MKKQQKKTAFMSRESTDLKSRTRIPGTSMSKSKNSTIRLSTGLKSRTRILETFWGALIIIALSVLPYFHDIITTSEGLRSWVPVLGIENLLTDGLGNILGFSTYRVFLYTLLIFVFASVGWVGWYQSAKDKFYGSALLLAMASGIYHIGLVLLNLRRSVWNEPTPKILLLLLLFVVFGYFSIRKNGLNLNKLLIWLLLLLMATLPFYHDIVTDRAGALRSWVPDFGIEEMLTDSKGLVRGLGNYRILVYLFCIHLFSHLGWIGWFMDSRGKRYRPFLLVPVILSLYQVIVITMSWRETEFNSPSIKLYITLGLSIILAINFYYNNKYTPETENALINTNTIKPTENEN